MNDQSSGFNEIIYIEPFCLCGLMIHSRALLVKKKLQANPKSELYNFHLCYY